MKKADKFLKDFVEYTKKEPLISGVALVGSYARGEEREDSDIDLVILAKLPELFYVKDKWIEDLGEVKRIEREDWGILQAKRVFYENGLEVEFGLAEEMWAFIPVNLGTKRVVKNGMKILLDKQDFLKTLVETVNS